MPLGRQEVIDGHTYSYCSHCNEEYDHEEGARNCCCYVCGECGEEYRYEEDAISCCDPEEEPEPDYACTWCGSYYHTQEEAENCHVAEREEQRRLEERHRERAARRAEQQSPNYPREVLHVPVGYSISVPEIEGRPRRLCSVEQELTEGGRRVARMLYDMGIGGDPNIVNYSNQGTPGMALVKEDGSLERGVGGEVVYSRFDLSHPNQSRQFSKAIWAIRQLRNRGLVKTARNAGTHIHISAISQEDGSVFGPGEMAKLYEINSFCEDVLYALGSAGWASHRGTQYTIPMPSFGKEVTAGKVSKNALRDRHFSLNFVRLLNAAQQCRCGACPVGDWQECECGVLGAGTVEWRVFNATTKPETMHGWLLLAHALTAKAFDHSLGSLDPNQYTMTDHSRHAWILGWILRECPFTDTERMIVLSLAKRAPGLAVDWENDFGDNPPEFLGFRYTDEEGDEEAEVA